MTIFTERHGQWLATVLILLVTAVTATAQVTTGTISGAVKDDQGLRVPGASVTLISESRGTRLSPVITNATGDFVVPNVTADTYTIEVSLPGFSTLRRPGVEVSGGDRVGVGELALNIGGASETITVTSEAALLQTQSGERSFRVTTTEVQNLPILNRNFASLTTLTPGVTGTNRLGGGGQNNFMIDGASAMDTGNNGQVLQLNMEAIAEVKVLTAGYAAEYGRSSGLQITAVTKSGTNAFHGSVYDIERNSDWNSNTWVNRINGVEKTDSAEKDFGFSFGGPVGRAGGDNKLFVFYSHEFRPRSRGGDLVQLRVPTAAERRGDFSQSLDNDGAPIPQLRNARTGQPFPGNVIPADQLYAPGMAILNNLWPQPNITQVPGSSYNYEIKSPTINEVIQQPAIRVDYAPTSSLRVTGKFAGQRSDQNRFGDLPGFDNVRQPYLWVKTFTTSVNYTVNSTTFLETTWGFANRRLGRLVTNELANRFTSGLDGIPYIYPDANILPEGSYNKQVMEDVKPAFYQNGRAELAPTFVWGDRIGEPPPSLEYPSFLNTNPVRDFSVSVTKVAGRHTFKGGFYMNSSQKSQNLNQRNALPFQGEIDFGDNSNNPLDTGFGFANAAVGVFNQYLQQGSFVEGDFVYKNVEGYLQDNWKLTPGLTLDYGVRFTYQQPQYDANGQASNFFIDRYNRAEAPALFTAGCAGASPCSGSNRQAFNPVTQQLLGPGTSSLIGQIVPNSGNLTNGIVLAGNGISKYNYEWPTMVLSPRFGFAYDLTSQQEVVLRGGVGMFVDRPDGDSVYYQSQNPPTSSSTILRYGRLQSVGTGDGIASQGVPTLINYRYENDGLPSSVQWNVGLQTALPFSSALDVSYVGQHSYNVLNAFQSRTAVNINAIDFGAAYLAENQDPTLKPGVPGAAALSTDLLRPIRGYGNIDQQWQDFERTYHSVQTSFTRRFRNGFSGGFNYTLSLSDTGTTGTQIRLEHAADGSYSVRDDQAAFNELMKDQGLRRHLVKANFVWDLPDLRAETGGMRVLAAVINDWQIAGVFTGGSGAKYDATYRYQRDGANVNLTGSPDYAARIVVNGDVGSGCSSDRFRQFNTSAFSGPLPGSLGMESGNNLLTGCADHTTDLSFSRNIRLGGGRSIQLRADVFNAFDTVVFSGRNARVDLVSPTNQTVRNPQYLADGSVDPGRVKTTSAGFGAVTAAQALRTVQLQARFSF